MNAFVNWLVAFALASVVLGIVVACVVWAVRGLRRRRSE
jgi:hypothetical protein